MTKVEDLFYIKYGVNLELQNCEIVSSNESDSVNFVARTSQNNGVVAKVKRIPNILPQEAGTISCAAGGSVLSTFVQAKPYYSGRDLYVLTPKRKMSLNEKLYYAMCISLNSYKYNYGRQANKTLKNIIVPDVVPEWVNEKSINFEILNTVNTKGLTLNELNKRVLLADIFEMTRGKRLTKYNREQGSIPFVTAGYLNEGINDYISNKNVDVYSNCLTIDMFGNCFYRNYTFACDDNILVLKNNEFDKYIYLFLATVINMDKYKCNYGRQYRQKDFNKHFILLPEKNGDIDYSYMREYIKSLPYADKI